MVQLCQAMIIIDDNLKYIAADEMVQTINKKPNDSVPQEKGEFLKACHHPH